MARGRKLVVVAELAARHRIVVGVALDADHLVGIHAGEFRCHVGNQFGRPGAKPGAAGLEERCCRAARREPPRRRGAQDARRCSPPEATAASCCSGRSSLPLAAASRRSGLAPAGRCSPCPPGFGQAATSRCAVGREATPVGLPRPSSAAGLGPTACPFPGCRGPTRSPDPEAAGTAATR